jgi:hypothetical protein
MTFFLLHQQTSEAPRAAPGSSASSGNPPAHPETKQAQVLGMLRRKVGASGPHIAEAMGWRRTRSAASTPAPPKGHLYGLSYRRCVQAKSRAARRQVAIHDQSQQKLTRQLEP